MNPSARHLRRCFYALPLPSELNRTVSDIIAELRRYDNGAVNWTPTQNLHLTLRFLGELEEELFNRGGAFLRSESFGNSFQLRIGDVDAFPSLRKPSVLVLSVVGEGQEDHQALLVLQQRTEAFARQLGLEPEHRPFRPHITLGRVRRERSLSPALRNGLQEMQEKIREEAFGKLTGEAHALLFLESLLTPQGATYREEAKGLLT